MKKLLLIVLAFTLFNTVIYSQGSVGIGTTTPNSSAALDISSTTKGMLMPRMTTAQRNLIATPAAGLIVFNLDDQCIDIYDGTNWIKNCGMKITGTDTIPPTWTQKTNFPFIRSDAVGFSIGIKGYVGTGSQGGTLKKDFWEFDPGTNAWTQKADFGGTARTSAIGAGLFGYGYIGTGLDGQYRSDMWEYNPATNSWTQRADISGGGRSDAFCAVHQNGIVVGCGQNASDWLQDVKFFNPSMNSWSAYQNFPDEGHSKFAFVANGNLFAGSGYTDFGIWGTGLTNTVFKFDGSSWSSAPNFPGGEMHSFVSGTINNLGIVGVGKEFGAQYNSKFWLFNGATSTWSELTTIPGPGRAYATGFVIGSKLYLGTGFNGTELQDFWELNLFQQGNVYTMPTMPATWAEINDGIWKKTTTHIEALDAPFRITESGNVGIGTSTPNATLQFGNTLTNRKLVLWETANNDHQYHGFGVNAGIMRYQLANSSSSHVFYSANSGFSSTELLRIQGNGNIGIGLSTATNKLDIAYFPRTGTHPTNLLLYATGSLSDAGGGFEIKTNDGTQGIGIGRNTIYATGSSASQNLSLTARGSSGELIFNTNALERVRILGNGQVGIGTSTPGASALLELNSNSRGILIPRMTTTQRTSIASPQVGLLVFDNSTNSFWYRGTSAWLELTDNLDQEVFRNGTDKIYMGLTDSVGIGTNSPIYKLDVRTAVNQYGFAHTNGSVNVASWIGNGGEIGTVSNHAFRLFANDGLNQFELLPNGNIGLGLHNATNKLDIATVPRTGTHPSGLAMYVSGDMSDAANGFEIRHTNGTQGVGMGYNSLYAAGSNPDQNLSFLAKGTNGVLAFYTNSTNRLWIAGNGNIGIGNTAPHAPLQFTNDLWSRKIVIYESANNDHQYQGFGTNAATFRYQLENTTSSHVFYAATSTTTSNELVRIMGNGNVGIGFTGNVNNKLDVQSAVRSGSHASSLPLYITSNMSDASGGAEFRHTDGTQGIGIGRNTIYAAGSNASQNLSFSAKGATGEMIFSTNTAERVRIDENGFLGVGTSNPLSPLHITAGTGNRKIAMWQVNNNDHEYIGFGVNGDGSLRYQTAYLTNDHIFYTAINGSSSDELFRIKSASGNIAIKGVIENEAFIAPTLVNGFSNYGGNFAPAGYFKDEFSTVHLRGLVTTAGDPDGDIIFTLPVGYRPPYQLIFTTINNDTTARIDVFTDGTVKVAFGSTGWFNLEQISFRTN